MMGFSARETIAKLYVICDRSICDILPVTSIFFSVLVRVQRKPHLFLQRRRDEDHFFLSVQVIASPRQRCDNVVNLFGPKCCRYILLIKSLDEYIKKHETK